MVRIMAGQGFVMTAKPPALGGRLLPCRSTTSASMPKNGRVAEPGFKGTVGRGVIKIMPVSVCHQVSMMGLSAAGHTMIPFPGFRIDRLSDSSQDSERREVVFLRPVFAVAHEQSDRGRGRVENRDPIALDQIPPSARIRIIRLPSAIRIVAPLRSGP